MEELKDLENYLLSINNIDLIKKINLLSKIASEEIIIGSVEENISDGLKYHIENQIPIIQPIYREGTEKYYKLIIEAKNLYESGKLFIDLDSVEFLTSDIGKFGEYNGDIVPLDSPMEIEDEDSVIKFAAEFQGKNVQLNKPRTLRKGEPGYGRKQYVVYVKDGDRVKRITFGDPNLKAKPEKAKNRKSFRARHKCDQKKDKTTPGYWACRYPPNW